MKNILFLLIFGVISQSMFSQDLQSFKVIGSDNEPLIGVTYNYGNQNGISNEKGILVFNYKSGLDMELSYVGYGNWVLSDAQILKAMEDGSIYRESLKNALRPVSIIALRPNRRQVQDLKFDYQDHMSHDGGALLRQVASIGGIRKSGAYGFDPVFRGFKYDQLNVVMNGIQCATAACPNRMDPPTSQMAPNMIDRVEILKGPYALRYGGGIGATINFISEDFNYTIETNVNGRLSGRYDSNGEVLRSEAKVGLQGKVYDIALLTSFANGNDYMDGSDNIILADFSRNSVGLHAGFKLSAQQELEVSATHNWAKDTDFPALMMDLRKDNTTLVNLHHTVNFETGKLRSLQTSLFGSYVDHLMDNGLKNLDPRMMNASTNANTFNFGGRVEGVLFSGPSKIYFGLDHRSEEAQGIRIRDFLLGPMAGKSIEDNAWQHSKISKTGAFAEWQMNHNLWQYVFSTRLELNQATVLDGDAFFIELYENLEPQQFNPSLSLGATYKVNKKLTAGLWLARAQRSGSLTERYINRFAIGQDPFELLGNPELLPEVNYQSDIIFEFDSKPLKIKLDLFASYLDNYISSAIDPNVATLLPNRPGVRRFINIENATKYGFEFGVIHSLSDKFTQVLDVAYTYGQDLERDEPLPEIAPLDMRYKIQGRNLVKGFGINGQVRYVSAQNRISIEYGESITSSFVTVDLSMNHNFLNNYKVEVGVNNLLNETYAEHLNRSTIGTLTDAINAPGRNIYVSFGLKF